MGLGDMEKFGENICPIFCGRFIFIFIFIEVVGEVEILLIGLILSGIFKLIEEKLLDLSWLSLLFVDIIFASEFLDSSWLLLFTIGKKKSSTELKVVIFLSSILTLGSSFSFYFFKFN
jgi:hypothetical protein